MLCLGMRILRRRIFKPSSKYIDLAQDLILLFSFLILNFLIPTPLFPIMISRWYFIAVACLSIVNAENIVMTEVFIIRIEPMMFNWTYEGDPEQFVYQPSLINSPDLPSWINYHYSNRYHTGFLYGVPPENHQTEVLLEVVALNRKNYETKHRLLPIHIIEKLNPAKSEVHLKIDNLNVEDMFDTERIKRLKDVFIESLWKDSMSDLYITFLASAVQLGARLPLNPSEGEGVVIRIGSRAHLSSELINLQKEVKPLWKHTSCPRDFKRTTVERIFRDAGFALDWCVFRLIEDSSSAMQQHSSTNLEKLEELSNLGTDAFVEDRWESVSKGDVPQRSYSHDFAFTILIPIFVMTILALMLSFILCFHHEGISRDMDDTPKHEINHYATIHRATRSLRSMSNNRDLSCLSPEMNSRSHTGSPTSTIRGIHCRPSPPPYVRPKFKPDL